jgi:histidine ammonia-lyase
MGEGDVKYKGSVRPAKEVLQQCGIEALALEAKEGLSLINGTQFMTVLAAFAIQRAKTISSSADIIAGLSLSAVRGTSAAFDPRISSVRPQVGQSIVAKNMMLLFSTPDVFRKCTVQVVMLLRMCSKQ